MTEQEKQTIRDIYKMVVQFAHSSHITKRIYRMHPEAFFKPRVFEKLECNCDHKGPVTCWNCKQGEISNG